MRSTAGVIHECRLLNDDTARGNDVNVTVAAQWCRIGGDKAANRCAKHSAHGSVRIMPLIMIPITTIAPSK
jgi:hypothetical protein